MDDKAAIECIPLSNLSLNNGAAPTKHKHIPAKNINPLAHNIIIGTATPQVNNVNINPKLYGNL